MTDDVWNVRFTKRTRDRLEPLARRDGLDPANMARHLLEVALRERLAKEHQQTRAIIGGSE
jgi:hypothetical protein